MRPAPVRHGLYRERRGRYPLRVMVMIELKNFTPQPLAAPLWRDVEIMLERLGAGVSCGLDGRARIAWRGARATFPRRADGRLASAETTALARFLVGLPALADARETTRLAAAASARVVFDPTCDLFFAQALGCGGDAIIACGRDRTRLEANFARACADHRAFCKARGETPVFPESDEGLRLAALAS
jgi:hypothetical protein